MSRKEFESLRPMNCESCKKEIEKFEDLDTEMFNIYGMRVHLGCDPPKDDKYDYINKIIDFSKYGEADFDEDRIAPIWDEIERLSNKIDDLYSKKDKRYCECGAPVEYITPKLWDLVWGKSFRACSKHYEETLTHLLRDEGYDGDILGADEDETPKISDNPEFWFLEIWNFGKLLNEMEKESAPPEDNDLIGELFESHWEYPFYEKLRDLAIHCLEGRTMIENLKYLKKKKEENKGK